MKDVVFDPNFDRRVRRRLWFVNSMDPDRLRQRWDEYLARKAARDSQCESGDA